MASGRWGPDAESESWFVAAVDEIAVPLRRALISFYGADVGVEAAADVWVWAWEHREEWIDMENPAGYLFRVGQSAARRYRKRPVTMPVPAVLDDAMPIAPELPAALQTLSPRQRSAVLLVHGYGYGLTEAAQLLGLSVSTLRNHLTRGLRHLKEALKETTDG
jgi:DNA-directed RNA polymerase specialized sigma24 family protein